jgi:hypothetical protein
MIGEILNQSEVDMASGMMLSTPKLGGQRKKLLAKVECLVAVAGKMCVTQYAC